MAKIAPEIQDVAHTVGDSLKLAFRAQYAEADLLVFSDVNFMAETAKILAPTKTVLVPVLEATYPVTHHTPSTAGEAKPALMRCTA